MEFGETELDLSLTLNGRLSSDPPRPKKDILSRSLLSSSSLLLEVPAAHEAEECSGGLTTGIARSCWWPAMHGAEEEGDEEENGRKKRKEMQSLRRMEVKKRRMEKQRSVDGGSHARGGRPRPGGRFRFRRGRRELDSDLSQRQGRGGGSSGFSSGSNWQQASAVAWPPVRRKRSNDIKSSAEQMLRSLLEDMPRVCGKVDGPNRGRVVEGFLFRNGKGEGIKIVCICHGRFLSPAEFVEHAGGSGRDVVHPLKHIVVCPPSW